jgi:hypothetical protein
MNSFRNNPDGPENTEATKRNERYVGGLRLHHALCDVNDKNPDGIVKPCNCDQPQCACVHHDARDCAWIRDGRPSMYRDRRSRECGCACHSECRDEDSGND